MVNRVGEFEKVSFEQYYSAWAPEGGFGREEKQKEFEDDTRWMYDNIQIPVRSTAGSAGYDIRVPFGFKLNPGETVKIPTGLRVKIDEGWWLGVLPRSSLGFKYRLQLDNTVGVIDSDYYYSDNEGHIFLKITNDSINDKAMCVEAGDSIAQAIFIPYGITYSDNADGVRNGGIGSTGR